MKKGDKKRFEKAMHQLGSAFEKAKEVNTPMQKKMATDRVGQTERSTLDNLPNETKQLVKKQHKELKLEMPSKSTERLERKKPEPIETKSIRVSEKQPDREVKKIPRQVTPPLILHKDTEKKEKISFDNSFGKAVEKLAKKKPQISGKVAKPQKTEPQKEIEVAFCNDIDLSNKKAFQDILENSLYSVLNEILQKKVPFDIPLPEEFYQDSEMVLKNRTSLKEKFSQFSDIKLDFYVQLGEMDITLGDLLDFKEGSILETEIAFSTSLNCYANKKLLGQGELIFDGYIAGFKLQSFSNQ